MFAVEIAMTRRHVCYLKSLDDSKLDSRLNGRFKFFTTPAIPEGFPVPDGALKTSFERANYLKMILSKGRRVVQVVEVQEN